MSNLTNLGASLHCVQCDRRGSWYSPDDSERHVAKCQNGLIEATKCANTSHTHCIFSYYRQGASSSKFNFATYWPQFEIKC